MTCVVPDHSVNTPPPSLPVVCGSWAIVVSRSHQAGPLVWWRGGRAPNFHHFLRPGSQPLLCVSRQWRWSFSQHVDKGGGEQASLVGGRLQDALHPVVVLSLLGQDHNDISLLECKLIFIVRLAIIERTTSFITVKLVSLK